MTSPDSVKARLRQIAIAGNKPFNSVKISPISLEWVGGIDMCPDELYYNSIPVNN
jgi:hypothetical protein